MKDEINLLPPGLVRQRRRQVISRKIGAVLRRIMIAEILLLVIAGAGGAGNTMLKEIVAQQMPEVSEEQENIQAEIRAFNTFIREMDGWRVRYRAWSPVVVEVLKALPEGVRVSELEADASGRITIKGEFKQPDQIVAYQRELEKLDEVDRVEAPLSNFSTGSNLKFELTVVTTYAE